MYQLTLYYLKSSYKFVITSTRIDKNLLHCENFGQENFATSKRSKFILFFVTSRYFQEHDFISYVKIFVISSLYQRRVHLISILKVSFLTSF